MINNKSNKLVVEILHDNVGSVFLKAMDLVSLFLQVGMNDAAMMVDNLRVSDEHKDQ